MVKQYYSDDKVDQIHWEVQKKIEKKKSNPLQRIPTSAIVFISLAGLLIAYLAIAKGVDPMKLILGLLVMAGIIILMSSRNPDNDMLTEQECKAELYVRLKWKQKNPLGMYREIPDGQVAIDIKTRLRHYDGVPWKRYSGFAVITEDELKIDYYASQNPYTGDIIELNECPGGFDPSDIQDIVMIASPQLQDERRWTEMGGHMPGGK